MRQNIIAILILAFCFSCNIEGASQNYRILKDCKILSIDTISFLPNHYVIMALTEIGKVTIYSEKSNKKNKGKKIRKNRKYDLVIIEIDSITFQYSDSTYYYPVGLRKGERGPPRPDHYGIIIYSEDLKEQIGFFDYNYIPFKAYNLEGLHYKAIRN